MGEVALPNPFFARFPQTLELGQTLSVFGVLSFNATLVSLKLMAGGPNGRILRKDLRFDNNELDLNNGLPFAWDSLGVKPGKLIELRIRVRQDMFELRINGSRLTDIKHGGNFNDINCFEVSGGIQHTKIGLRGKDYPETFSGTFPHGALSIGEKVEAYVTLTGKEFSFNFLDGEDTLLHWKPHINGNKQTIVRNYRVGGGGWPKEENNETPKPFPIKKNVGFHVTFIYEEKQFNISINGEPLEPFAHLFPERTYKSIEIRGNVTMESLDIR